MRLQLFWRLLRRTASQRRGRSGIEAAMPSAHIPRLVIGGLSGNAGKTLVSLALLLEARRIGIPVRAFKKGPDYIDAAWLTWASGHPARNLDSYLTGFPGIVQS